MEQTRQEFLNILGGAKILALCVQNEQELHDLIYVTSKKILEIKPLVISGDSYK